MGKAAAAPAAASLALPTLEALLDAWGISYAEILARVRRFEELNPGTPVTAVQVAAIIEQFLTRNHISTMIQKAGALVYDAIQTGRSENELDPSALS